MKVTGSHTKPPETKVGKIESKEGEKEKACPVWGPLPLPPPLMQRGDVSAESLGAWGLLKGAGGAVRKGRRLS